MKKAKQLLALPLPLTWVLAPAAILNSPGNQVCEETNLIQFAGDFLEICVVLLV